MGSMQDVERGVAPTFEMQRFGSMEDSTSASPRASTIILDPLAPLVSAPVPEVIVETVPLKSILTKAVDPTVGRTATQKQAKKSVHWGRAHFKFINWTQGFTSRSLTWTRFRSAFPTLVSIQPSERIKEKSRELDGICGCRS